MKTSLVLVSGGMDSVTLLHAVFHRGLRPTVLSVNYNQRHQKEIGFAAYWAKKFGSEHVIIDIPDLGALVAAGTVLTGAGQVPEGHYAADNMTQTVVPFRNPLMLSLAMAIASARGIDEVAAAVHAGDHHIYPDCRPPFVHRFREMSAAALEGLCIPELYTPFILKTKADIAALGEEYGVDWAQTWSCYKGHAVHCGRCGTCVERLEALHKAGANDTTQYEDPDFWKSVVEVS